MILILHKQQIPNSNNHKYRVRIERAEGFEGPSAFFALIKQGYKGPVKILRRLLEDADCASACYNGIKR